MSGSLAIEPWEQLYRYWLARHVDGRPPSRAQIDPMIDLPHLASSLMLIDFRESGSAYRLVGSEVVSRYGMDSTGKLVGSSKLRDRQVIAWSNAVRAAATEGRAQLLFSYYAGANGPQTVAVLMPLAPNSDGAITLLGGAFFGQPFPRPGAYKELTVLELVLEL
jgi:hypothetical protein